MRSFFSTYWKAILLIVVLAVLAALTMSASSVRPHLSARLRAHVHALASSEQTTSPPEQLERAANYIETELAGQGYPVHRQQFTVDGQAVRNLEVSLSNLQPNEKPARIFIVGAHYDPARDAAGVIDSGGGTAAVLELARLLRNLRTSAGTELKFVFVARGLDHGHPGADSFIAFIGTRASADLVRQTLSAFHARPGLPAEGLAAPAYVQGVTLSTQPSYNRFGYPALMLADTAFLGYPYHAADDAADQHAYENMARVVTGLARTIPSLIGAQGM